MANPTRAGEEIEEGLVTSENPGGYFFGRNSTGVGEATEPLQWLDTSNTGVEIRPCGRRCPRVHHASNIAQRSMARAGWVDGTRSQNGYQDSGHVTRRISLPVKRAVELEPSTGETKGRKDPMAVLDGRQSLKVRAQLLLQPFMPKQE